MTDTERPNLSRRRMLTAAAILPAAAAAGALGSTSPAAAAPGGQFKLTRGQVLNRADYWLHMDPPIPYSMSRYHRDPDDSGHDYRTDCSGFVSMCWHTYLGSNGGYSTETIPSITTNIRWRDLKPGDAMNWENGNDVGHVRLFDSWSIRTSWCWFYEMTTAGGGGMRKIRLDADDMQNIGYIPVRYGNITD